MSAYRLITWISWVGSDTYLSWSGRPVWTARLVVFRVAGILLHSGCSWRWKSIFVPVSFPFPVHIDTGHNFKKALDYRDRLAETLGEKLIVRHVGDTIKYKAIDRTQRKVCEPQCFAETFTLLDTIEEFTEVCCLHRRLVRRGEEKGKGQRKDILCTGWICDSGIPQAATSWIVGTLYNGKRSTKARMYAYSRRPVTGPNWMYGTIYVVKKIELPSILFLPRTGSDRTWRTISSCIWFPIQLEDSDKSTHEESSLPYRKRAIWPVPAAVESGAYSLLTTSLQRSSLPKPVKEERPALTTKYLWHGFIEDRERTAISSVECGMRDVRMRRLGRERQRERTNIKTIINYKDGLTTIHNCR